MLPLALLALAWFWVSPGRADTYRWVDASGGVHFTDSLHNVPAEYRTRVKATFGDDAPAPLPPRPSPEAPRGEVALERKEFGYVVAARINDREPARLVVDTGATGTVLSSRIAERLGLTVRRDPPVLLETANGRVEAGWAEVDRIAVGDVQMGPLRVVVHDAMAGADGLLGMNFLGAFRVEIRSQGPTLRLDPP